VVEHERARGQSLAIAAYGRGEVYAMLSGWTADELRGALGEGRIGERLAPDERAELLEHLTAWAKRALGPMPLRDALLVDERRGRRVFALLCAAHTLARAPLPAELAAALPAPPAPLAALPAELAARPELASVAVAASAGAALALQAAPDDYPYPDDLATLLPAPPRAYRAAQVPFQQATGWRRRLAALLAATGVALLGIPVLMGHIPAAPAGIPLALLTLALLVGIRARWPGYAGAFCIWLVANLPGFRHGTAPGALWPALPLMIVGLLLLSLDRHVRAMWRWLRERLPL
jgi:hypothetical protein